MKKQADSDAVQDFLSQRHKIMNFFEALFQIL